jgi:hypothetical protein
MVMKEEPEETRKKAVITYFTLPEFVRKNGEETWTVPSRANDPNPTLKMSA